MSQLVLDLTTLIPVPPSHTFHDSWLLKRLEPCIFCHQIMVTKNGCNWCFSPQHYEARCTDNDYCYCIAPISFIDNETLPCNIEVVQRKRTFDLSANEVISEDDDDDYFLTTGLPVFTSQEIFKHLRHGYSLIDARSRQSNDKKRCIVFPTKLVLKECFYWIFILTPSHECAFINHIGNTPHGRVFAFSYNNKNTANYVFSELENNLNADSFERIFKEMASIDRDAQPPSNKRRAL